MKRTLAKELEQWKHRPDRKPLIVRGARQVGKTFLVDSFGRENFESVAFVNFEEQKEMALAFQSALSPETILRDLSSRLRLPIIPGKTLLFLDEIQACPNALASLRFFKEKMPEMHVVAAGSLLEFTLKDANFSFPVGRVESLYLRPLSLWANTRKPPNKNS